MFAAAITSKCSGGVMYEILELRFIITQIHYAMVEKANGDTTESNKGR